MAPQRSSPTDQRDRDRNRVSRLLKSHAPPDWERRFRATELLDAVIDGEPIQMFVMAADIRVYGALGVSVSRESRSTKEYPRGQEVYALTFERDGPELETPNEHADEEAPHDVIDVSDPTGAGDGKVS